MIIWAKISGSFSKVSSGRSEPRHLTAVNVVMGMKCLNVQSYHFTLAAGARRGGMLTKLSFTTKTYALSWQD